MSRGGTRDVEGDLNLQAHPEVLLQIFDRIGPVTVYIVDGVLVRKHIYLNFTQGGNYMAYPWLKEKLILLEDANERDRLPILFHELYETNCMEQDGEKYDVAHEHADEGEIKIRHNPALFQSMFEKEVQRLERYHGSKWGTKVQSSVLRQNSY